MPKYILAHRSCIPTAKAIREGLYFLMNDFFDGEALLVTSRLNKARDNIIINWGRSDVSQTDFYGPVVRALRGVVNDPVIVRVSSRRLYDGINIQKVEWIEGETPWVFQFPIVGRDVFRMGGESVRLIRTLDDFNRDPPRYWSPYIPFDAEYRILLFGIERDFYARVFRKDPIQEDDIVHNNETCKYHLIRRPRIVGLSRFLGEVHRFLSDISSIYFVGLDVGRYNQDLYLIEINSAPGLNSTSVAFFTTGLLSLFWRRCQ